VRVVLRTILKVFKSEYLSQSEFLKIKEKLNILKYNIFEISKLSKKYNIIFTYHKFIKYFIGNFIFIPSLLKKNLNILESKFFKWENGLIYKKSRGKQRCGELIDLSDLIAIQLEAPLIAIRKKLKQKGFISKLNKPIALRHFLQVPVEFIIK